LAVPKYKDEVDLYGFAHLLGAGCQLATKGERKAVASELKRMGLARFSVETFRVWVHRFDRLGEPDWVPDLFTRDCAKLRAKVMRKFRLWVQIHLQKRSVEAPLWGPSGAYADGPDAIPMGDEGFEEAWWRSLEELACRVVQKQRIRALRGDFLQFLQMALPYEEGYGNDGTLPAFTTGEAMHYWRACLSTRRRRSLLAKWQEPEAERADRSDDDYGDYELQRMADEDAAELLDRQNQAELDGAERDQE
jgi:hypothetical protein